MKANGKDGDSENVQPIIKIPPSSDRTENTHRSPAAITSEKKKIREGYQIYVPGRGGLKVKEDRKPKCEYGKAPNELVEKERKKPIKTEAGEAKNEVKKTGKTNDSQLDGRTTKIGSAESDTNESTPSENIKSSERKSRSKSPEKRPNSPRSSMSNNLLPVVNGVAYSSNSNQPSSSTSVEPTVTKSSYGRNCPSLSSCCGEDDFEFPSLRIANGNTGSYRDDYSFDGDQQPSTSQTPRYIPSDLRKQDGITTKVIKQPLVFENSTLKRQDSPHSSRRTDSNENRSRFTLCNSSERYVDTHCHWDFIFDAFQKMKCRVHSVEDLERMFPGAFPTNFGGCIPNIIDPSVLRHHMGWVRAIIENHYTIGMAYGCHPNKAKEWNEDFEKRLADIIQDTDTYKTIALGEFGLDFYKMGAPKEKQLEALRGQLQLALHFEMPIIIHCRGSDSDDAEDLCLAELKGVNIVGKKQKLDNLHEILSQIEYKYQVVSISSLQSASKWI
ncbi:hypothetical protein WR25_05991 isoform F [Diploscapter pachys]|uniref:TatD related DNase n=1 Tax=Diploscapter pachys TaxID=2018661 RepID=A0A2A2LQ86_9BILA|nr:hypothetical protein WR25_05991 isoform B [Diploscapter pachys]PAV88402.1 hypothetical protein WR25_05991 isoform E [Diploscapter pachys]PAV88403.1 hypothetical protein WR25_05991 isoform F [Diploscapter pachys]